MKNTIIVCEYGWIFCGIKKDVSENATFLTNASVVRRWTNGKGIGGLAKADNKHEYTLDSIGDIEIKQNKILFEIPCEW